MYFDQEDFNDWFGRFLKTPKQYASCAWNNYPDVMITHHTLAKLGVDKSNVERVDIAYYVSKCIDRGFVLTPIIAEQCVERYLVGKRKVTPPFTRRRKDAEKKVKKELQNVPKDVLDAVIEAKQSNAYNQYLGGNEKSLNAAVGMVIKKTKCNPALARKLLEKKL